MMQLIELFQDANYAVTFLSAALASSHSADLETMGVTTGVIALNHHSAENVFKEINPDVVMFDRFMTEEQFGWKLTEVCPNAIKILDTEDLHFLRKAREKAFKNNTELKQSDFVNDEFKREMAAILRCDLSLIISEFEFGLLRDTFNIDESMIAYLPMFAEVEPGEIEFCKRKNFISIGNFLHEPNWQTVLKLKHIWPKIKAKLPDAELHVYGAYVTEKARQLHNENEKFLIKGRAENLQDIFGRAKVLLAPIPFGAGIKGKLLDAMRLGLPSITTPAGAEAMNGDLPWNGAIAPPDDAFIQKSVDFYTDEHLWCEARSNGFEIVRQRFRKELFESDFLARLQEISTHLNRHRTRNFLGQILQHHTLQSTKYLGKWIEEKNRHQG